MYSEKVTKFCKISTLLLSVCTLDKSKLEISQNFVAFSEYSNFKFGVKKNPYLPSLYCLKIVEKVNFDAILEICFYSLLHTRYVSTFTLVLSHLDT